MKPPVWHFLEIIDVVEKLGTRPEGLTDTEVSERITQYGRNEIIRRKPTSPWRLLLKQFANYFIFVLLFAAILAFAVSYLPGESGRRLTAYFILGIIVLSVALSFFEEYRAQKELEALDRLLVFKTTVLRAGSSSTNRRGGSRPGRHSGTNAWSKSSGRCALDRGTQPAHRRVGPDRRKCRCGQIS